MRAHRLLAAALAAATSLALAACGGGTDDSADTPAAEAVRGFDEQPVDSGAVQPPGSGEPGETAAHDDDVHLWRLRHGHLTRGRTTQDPA